MSPDAGAGAPVDFLRAIIEEDIRDGKRGGRVHTRFPPEPNGYLHVGHAKSIHLNFGIAAQYGGFCNLRFDDTNPEKEEVEYVESMKEDVRWLGFDWEDRLYFASDYFEQIYEWAEKLILNGRAYVCDLSADEVRETRGTLTEPGRPSPYRSRSAEENLGLFRRMRAGEFPDGSRTLRAKIDMASPNMNLRDPVMYRIRRATHHRTGDAWCIYPSYDWTHGQSDAIERITHSICTLEFEDHRPLYDWFLDQIDLDERPQQIEFAPLNVTYTITSKRRLRQLVTEGHVSGWDDPRLPTLCAMRRRGYTPEAIRVFMERIGLAKRESTVDIALLEHAVREDLNKNAPRTMAVLRPIRLVVESYPEGRVEEFEIPINPERPELGVRRVPFSREIYIEADDFRETPPKKYHRLYPGNEVRLRGAYLVTCTGVAKDPATGAITEIRCTHDPASRGGSAPDGRRVQGTIHWVSAAHSFEAEVRLYDHLFTRPDPSGDKEGRDFKEFLNPESLVILAGCRMEESMRGVRPGEKYQFERIGYFCVDTRDSGPGRPIFNRTVTLRDTWARIEKAQR
ncbi:MAG: glutamine--tRNA ligase/YqeY domain fusion protein [Candidatus Eisenbacteria bacterium]|nr:glutamine--tRNA ligase/YqeY domain fusion protein [Candidatus Eisenbacteria bacterium]